MLRKCPYLALVGWLAIIISVGHGPSVLAQEVQQPPLPINFSADEMDFDKNLGIVTARGNVEIINDQRTMLADTVSYNQKTDVMTATGNITLLEPNGDVVFAEYLEMTGDFKNGVIANIRMILSDSSRIAANGARRIDGDLDMRKVVYTACRPCEDNPASAPLWQIKAVKVYHDNTRHVVEYSDAWLELAGVPVFYTPYLTHPDPTVKRESGLLPPTFGNSSELGFTLQAPYFWNISEQTDMTITPAGYSSQGGGLITEFRHFPIDGELQINNSLINEDTGNLNGHLDSFGRFNIDQTWRWGFDAKYTSDDTYLRRYGFSSPQTLTSNAHVEGFRKRNYMRADTFYFQGLKSGDDVDTTPIIAPLLTFNHKSEPSKYGGQTTLDASFISMTRTDGVDLHRVSLRPGWETNYVSSFGELYKLSLNIDSDLYYINNYTPEGQGKFKGVTGRIFPQAKFDWRLPMVKQTGAIHQLIEPTASIVVSPNNVNPDKIANEDSQEFEFDETTLFRRSRFSGEDRADGGTRIDYGMQWGVFGENGGKTTAFVGQSYRLHKDSTFADNTGLEDNLSDVVAKVEVSPNNYLDVLYRTRISKKNGGFNRNEISFRAGVPLFTVNTQYQFFDKQDDSEFNGREDIYTSVSSKFNRNWHGSISMRHDLIDELTQNISSALIYEDECLRFSTQFSRSFFSDRELQPVDSILFTVTFKTLGEVRSN